MPINGLQTRFAQVGVIRLGRLVPTGRTNSRNQPTMRPEKLETFRFTSPSQQIIQAIAELYGGEAKPWQHRLGPQFEVVTNAKEIPVFVPPQKIDPNYEMWGNGHRVRHCNGDTETLRQRECMCRAQFGEGFVRTAPPGQACKPTTRMSVMLAEIQSLGVFKLESHGWNFASEMPMLATAIENATGPIQGRLELQVREGNILVIQPNGGEKVEPRRYMVPVIHFDAYTPAEAFGEIEGRARAAINGAAQRQAIGAGSTEEQPDWLALIEQADTPDAVNNLKDQLRAAGVKDATVVEAWKAKAASFSAPTPASAAAPATQPARSTAPQQPAPADDVIEGEDEPDGPKVFDEILALAGKNGWNMPTLEKKYLEHMGFDYRDDRSTGWKLAEFRDAVKAGAVK